MEGVRIPSKEDVYGVGYFLEVQRFCIKQKSNFYFVICLNTGFYIRLRNKRVPFQKTVKKQQCGEALGLERCANQVLFSVF